MKRKVSADLILAIAGVVIIALFAGLRALHNSSEISVPSTHDTGNNGLAALYDLLRRENVDAQRFEGSAMQLFARKGAIVVAGEAAILQSSLDKPFWRGMRDWVNAGGTLVLLGRPPLFSAGDLGLPQGRIMPVAFQARGGCALRDKTARVYGVFRLRAPLRVCTSRYGVLLRTGEAAVALAYRKGRGTVVYVGGVTPFDNAHIGAGDNAAFSYALFAPLGTVMFDEALYGYGKSKSMWSVLPRAVRFGVIVAAFALVLTLIGANLPFAPPRVLQTGDVRDSSEYVQSLASMLARSGARRDAVERLCAEIRRTLAPVQGQRSARALLEQAHTIEMLPVLDDGDVLAAAQILTTVRKDFS